MTDTTKKKLPVGIESFEKIRNIFTEQIMEMFKTDAKKYGIACHKKHAR